MPGPTMTAHELAQELGKSTSWLYSNWPTQCAAGLPMPLHDYGGLVWSRAQIYAWEDRNLSPELRAIAMAYRAAAAAAAGTAYTSDDTADIARSTIELNRKLGLR